MKPTAKPTVLPPPGPLSETDEGKASIVNYVNGLVRESWERGSNFNLWDRCQSNVELYLYGRTRDRRAGAYRANKIQAAVDCNAAIQSSQEPRLSIHQRTTGEPPKWYLNTAIAPPAVMMHVKPENYIPAADGSVQPLDDGTVELIQQAIQQSQMLAQAAGSIHAALTPDILIRIDDAVLREALELVAESKFEQGGGVRMFRENVKYTNIFGYQFTLQEWDDNNNLPRWHNGDPVCFYPDTTRTDISEMSSMTVDEFLGRDEAVSLFPSIGDELARYSATGAPTLAGSLPYRLPAFWYQKFFYREVVIVRRAWIRYQPYPIDEATAVKTGKVVLAPPPAAPSQTPNSGSADSAVSEITPNPENSEPATEPAAEGPESTEPVYLHPETGEAIEPGHPMWPTREGIREIVIAGGQLIRDAECERSNIPVLQNVNIPIPWTPWGQGEPERLESMQYAYNAVLTDIVVNGEFATSPALFVPESVQKQNPRLAGGAYVQPNAVYVVKDATWQAFQGNFVKAQMPPPTPPDQWKREEVIGRLLMETSDQSQSLRGNAPTSGASGVLVQELQQAGTTNIQAKGKRSEDMLVYGFKVLIGDILIRMEPQQLNEEFPKYPAPVWMELRRRWLKHYLFCSLAVEVAGGGASARANKANALIQAKVNGAFVSDPEIMENLDLDPQQQITKQADFERQKAIAMQSMPMQPQPNAGAPTGAAPAQSPASSPAQ